MILGCHLSASGGYEHMAEEIRSLGGNTFQFFTRNPRGGRARARDPEDERRFVEMAPDLGIPVIIAHAPYTLNACSAEERIREFARQVLEEDLCRMEGIPGSLYNFHPGSHVGQGLETGIRQIAGMLNAVLTGNMHTTVLLETMAGKGTEVGARFEELREILDRVDLGDRMGVCLDTCHVHDAGYDLAGDLDGVLTEFDRVVGLSRLKAVHLNDSRNPRGARKDRHEKIGEGALGTPNLVRVLTHPALSHLPFILETPNEPEGYAREIRMLREICGERFPQEIPESSLEK